MRIVQTKKRNLRVPKAEIKLWARYLLPDATGRLKSILFHRPTETFHFSTQWQGPYPDFGQGSDAVVDVEETPSTTNESSFMDDSDRAEAYDETYIPPAHPENEISNTAKTISDSTG